jgi:phage tail protein X
LTAISSSMALSLPPRVPGLAIAAEIAAAHGGTAEAARAFPRGLRIRLSLPDYASPRRIRTAAAPSSTSA